MIISEDIDGCDDYKNQINTSYDKISFFSRYYQFAYYYRYI